MKKRLIRSIGKIVGVFALLAALSAFAELGRPYAVRALQDREKARICERMAEILSRQTPQDLAQFPRAGVLPDGCVK